MKAEQVTGVLKEVGPLLDALGLECASDERSWALVFEEEPICLLECCDDGERFILSTELSALGDADRIGLYELMLMYNDQGATTGGVRLGVDNPDGAATMSVDLTPEELHPDKFIGLLEGFRALCAAWREIVEGWPLGGELTAPIEELKPRQRV